MKHLDYRLTRTALTTRKTYMGNRPHNLSAPLQNYNLGLDLAEDESQQNLAVSLIGSQNDI